MNISEILKDIYALKTTPTYTDVQKWYTLTLAYKQKGYSSNKAGYLAAKEIFSSQLISEFSEANESLDVRNQIDNIDTLLSIIRGKK
ncbi:TPA: hypothetical protein CPT82_05350 [Candidatus Gastranaerophilales bacterium HUM_2]|nr:MAG TPA: hypothetical protein CPT82_05350 [Candidatus Gastranaerophilales bacterium HUM_2]